MAANLWEWCYDWYPGSEGSKRNVRGGNWYGSAYYCQVGHHNFFNPGSNGTGYIGFRTVIDLRPDMVLIPAGTNAGTDIDFGTYSLPVNRG